MIERRREEGFTLVEVLVALLIIALASEAAFQAISGGASGLRHSRGERAALMLAESTLAQVGHVIAVQPVHRSGTERALRWTIDIGGQLADPPPALGQAAYPVQVVVRWRDDRGPQQLRLDSVRLGAPQPENP